ncbi:MAG: hypothetical protein IIT70_06365, partial [Clostridia bacterium]|nr:hypothetical protein [Clostridia bacterium]
YAELANETYGFGYSRDNAKITPYSETEYYVSFTDGNGPSLSVHYRYDRSTEWQYVFNDFFPGSDPDLGGMSMDTPNRWMPGEEFTVTYEDLGAAGYTPDSTANDYIAVARWVAEEMAEGYRNAPESNCFSCIEVDPGEPSYYAIPVIPGDTAIMHARLYCLPRDVNAFLEAALEVYPSIAGADEEYPGRVEMGLISINIAPTDGGWRCSIGYNAAGEALEGYMFPEEDAMSELIWRTDYLLEHGKDDIFISWHYIRYLYGMDWEEFGRHYTPAQWERIAEIMKPKAVGYGDWEQLRMDMHVMLGCENAPEGWWKGLSALLNEQLAYDPALFSEALSYLNNTQLEKVQSIMDRFPTGNTQN